MTWNSLKLLISNKNSRLVPNFFLFNFLFQTGVLDNEQRPAYGLDLSHPPFFKF